MYYLDFSYNNFGEEIPASIGSITPLIFVYLQHNIFSGSIPKEIENLKNLKRFYTFNNELSGELVFMPNEGTEYAISRNSFVFEDLENYLTKYPNSKTSYSYQANVDEIQTEDIDEGNIFILKVDATNSQNNSYQWRKNGGNITGENSLYLTFDSINASDAGVYDCIITNSLVTELILIKNHFTIVVNEDYDNDGISIQFDLCPNTAAGSTVNCDGCAQIQLDDDGDGITNDLDQCPNTVTNQNVDINGCAQEQSLVNLDREALTALYNSTNGSGWKRKWDLNKDIEYWAGVQLNEQGRVISIYMRNNDLLGSLPSEIGNLTMLTSLDLLSNNIEGKIPEEIGQLSNLWKIDLGFNRLTEEIPVQLGNLKHLQFISLQSNKISGNIPSGLSQIRCLEYMDLSNNELAGSIPPELGNLKYLGYLYLSTNQLSQSIPLEISGLDRVRTLQLDGNQITGNILPELSKLPNLEFLNLGNNQLSGTIPKILGTTPKLRSLQLSSNNLEGSIPPELGNLQWLNWLVLTNNKLTGSIPKELGRLNNLEYLYLYKNQLTGMIPDELGGLKKMKDLFIYENQLKGSIPSALNGLDSIDRINFSDNLLTGAIPESLGTLESLTTLRLNNNLLSGEVPEILTELKNLTLLHLNNNQLEGPVPLFDDLIESFNIENNNFVFENIENTFYNQPILVYSPQSNIGVSSTIEVEENQNFTFTITETISQNNTYQWRKNGNNIIGATTVTYTISGVDKIDEGIYDCLINNTITTELTLQLNPITLVVNSTLGIDNLYNTPTKKFSVYPNPLGKEDLTIHLSNSVADTGVITIFNAIGSKVSTRYIIIGHTSIIKLDDISIPSGIYFIQLELLGGERYMTKIIKR